MCYNNSEEYRFDRLSEFEILLQSRADTRDGLAREFSNFLQLSKSVVTPDPASCTMLQGKPIEFSDFHRFTANAASVNTFLLGEGDLLF